MNARHKKKLVESYQGKTISKMEWNSLMLASAVFTCLFAVFPPFEIETEHLHLDWFAVVVGSLLSTMNFLAWKNFILFFSQENTMLHFIFQKTIILALCVAVLLFCDTSFLLSILLGFVLHISVGTLMIILLFLVKRGGAFY